MSKKNEKVAKKPVKKSRNGKISNSKGKSKLTKDKLELKELQDKHLRLKAEFENFRRRKSDEISNILRFDGENIISEFCPKVILKLLASPTFKVKSLVPGAVGVS